MKRSAARSSRLLPDPLGLTALLIVLALVPGCVSRGAHQQVAKERDEYREQSALQASRIELLETSNASLSEERVALIDEIEDLRQRREELEERVGALERTSAELEANLRQSETELQRHSEEVEQLRETYGGLVTDLEAEVAAGQIEIDRLREGLRLNLSQEILFASGSARLNQGGRALIQKVAERLVSSSQQIEVRGHSDDRGIRGALSRRYPSNWELAGARASSVVRLLAESGVPPESMSAVSFGEFRPVAPNDTEEGRARNRRIEIRLLPVEGGTPVATDPPASD
jgi:chemotaxis protein MotB